MAYDAYSAPAPIEHPALARARLHRNLSTLIERLIGVLDDLGGDPDLEDGADDEPSLSATIPTLSWEGSQDRWLQGPGDDLEDDKADVEPSLCGIGFGTGNAADLEDACEDEGAVTGDDEPEEGE